MSDIVEQAKHCRDNGSFDAMHGRLLDEVERLRSAITGIREILDNETFRESDWGTESVEADAVRSVLAVHGLTEEQVTR